MPRILFAVKDRLNRPVLGGVVELQVPQRVEINWRLGDVLPWVLLALFFLSLTWDICFGRS
jgi:hypothetical protein